MQYWCVGRQGDQEEEGQSRHSAHTNPQAWIVLKDLLAALPIDDVDTLYKMIADGILYVRLEEDLVSEPERAYVFRDKITAAAYRVYLSQRRCP